VFGREHVVWAGLEDLPNTLTSPSGTTQQRWSVTGFRRNRISPAAALKLT